MDNTLAIVLICLCIFIVILMIYIIIKLNNNNNKGLENDLRSINDSLNQNLNQLSSNLYNTITSFKDNTNDRLLSLNSSISRVDEAQNSLKNLSANVEQLSRIFTDKKSRGGFGETELYSILTTVYGEPNTFWKKQYTIYKDEEKNVIADAAILGFKNGEIICIDSKFPMENYLRMNDDSLSEQDRSKATSEFKTNVKKHIDDIHDKYIIDKVTADFAFLFLPSEGIFSQIHNSFDDLIRYSYANHVYLTSPATLIAYLTAIKNLYLEFKKEQNANAILSLLKELSDEFVRFDKRNKELYDDLAGFAKKFKEVNITTEKIIKKFNMINNIENKQDGQD